jgi:hypothetical protein
MPAVLNDPIVRSFAIPFAASLILAGLIRWVEAYAARVIDVPYRNHAAVRIVDGQRE